MTPLDIVEVLTAAAPIVASVTNNMTSKNKCGNIDRKENPVMNISITINNNFYTKSNEEALTAAAKIQEQVMGGIASSNNHYIL